MNRKRHHKAFTVEGVAPEKETIWQTLSRITVTLIVVAALGVAFTFFIPEIDHQKHLDRDISQLESDLEAALAKRDSYRKQLRLLNDDREYLEIMARDLLDMHKEGEEILRIEGNESAEISSLTSAGFSAGPPPTE